MTQPVAIINHAIHLNVFTCGYSKNVSTITTRPRECINKQCYINNNLYVLSLILVNQKLLGNNTGLINSS